MEIFNFRDSHGTTFRHPSGAYIRQMPGHSLSRLAKGTPSESRLSISTPVWVKTGMKNSEILSGTLNLHKESRDTREPKPSKNKPNQNPGFAKNRAEHEGKKYART